MHPTTRRRTSSGSPRWKTRIGRPSNDEPRSSRPSTVAPADDGVAAPRTAATTSARTCARAVRIRRLVVMFGGDRSRSCAQTIRHHEAGRSVAGLLAALLHVGLHELLSVLLEHGIHLVEAVVQLTLEIRGVEAVFDRRLRVICPWAVVTIDLFAHPHGLLRPSIQVSASTAVT